VPLTDGAGEAAHCAGYAWHNSKSLERDCTPLSYAYDLSDLLGV
jgi:hypothetical protein